MMGKVGVGRIVGSIALVLGVLMGSFDAFSYGSATTHLEVTVAVLGGYGGDDFREFFAVTSGGGEREAGKGVGKQGVGRRHLDFPIFAKSGKHE